MTLELRLVEGDVLDADARHVVPRLDDPVDQKKGIAMRQGFQEVLNIQGAHRWFDNLIHGSLFGFVDLECPGGTTRYEG